MKRWRKRRLEKIRKDRKLMQSILTMTDWQCGPLSSRKACNIVDT